MPKIFLIACETSGDLHGASLVESLRKLDSKIEFEGLGGEAMKRAGVKLLEETSRHSVLGFGDVLRKYFYFRRIFYKTLRHVLGAPPDLLILIDSPAFNLRFAKKVRRRIPVIYYVSPQIWAWGWRRIQTIRRTVDHLLAILPFEEAMYQEEGVPCTFVGHPLLDRISPSQSRETLRNEFGIRGPEQVVALLPGSREPEVRRILPIMLESARLLHDEKPGLRFFLTRAPQVPPALYDGLLRGFKNLPLRMTNERLHDIVRMADFALVASGTATLETALLGTPFFLLYKASPATFFIGRRLVRLPYIGLVNVLAGRLLVPEFIQHLADPRKIAHETKVLLENDSLRNRLREEILEVTAKLGGPGASGRAAQLVLDKLSEWQGPRSGPLRRPAQAPHKKSRSR